MVGASGQVTPDGRVANNGGSKQMPITQTITHVCRSCNREETVGPVPEESVLVAKLPQGWRRISASMRFGLDDDPIGEVIAEADVACSMLCAYIFFQSILKERIDAFKVKTEEDQSNE